MSIGLIRRFEPILFFHKDEKFFPSDAKRYLEYCALWKAINPFDDKFSWEKVIDGKGICAAPAELSSTGDLHIDTYLGEKNGVVHKYLLSNNQEEHFLNPSGWIDQGGNPHLDVTPESNNQYAGLPQLSKFYDFNSAMRIQDLTDSLFWYHAEVFDARRLEQLRSNQNFTTLPVGRFFDENFIEPFIICYYMFFPGHMESIQECAQVETGPNFGSFAGEWVCVAIMLDRVSPNVEYAPKYLGLASRNANKNVRVLDEENRVGMVIHDWSEVEVFANAPDHVKLFVAEGTHSLHVKPGEKELFPLDPTDPSMLNCGATEKLAAKVIKSPKGAADLLIFKSIAIGVIGFIWALLEDKPFFTPFDEEIPPPIVGPQKDRLPEEGDLGIVILPRDFSPPGDLAGQHVLWPAEDTIFIKQRRYTLIVDRTSADENLRHVWLPGVGNYQGYEGRWGPRVVSDPYGRRRGMRFPKFVEMFLVALAKHKS